jgi:pyruvate dehydrogenase E2 component (dihydrolipoamide acetyltransferase)
VVSRGPSGPPRASLAAAVGRLMERSKREIPHFYLSEDIDLNAALAWLTAMNDQRSVDQRLLPAALLLRAVVVALRDAPDLNGHFVDGCFAPRDDVQLGLAVSMRQGGLIAPVIRDAHTLDLQSLMGAMRDVVGRARAGSLRSSDLGPATITVTNLGEQGAASVFGVIIPPQVAIVGFGRVTERVWVADGMIGIRSVVTASLSADHRASHGHRGSRFLTTLAKRLATPEELL